MARQLTERFPVDRAFRDLDVMLTEARPTSCMSPRRLRVTSPLRSSASSSGAMYMSRNLSRLTHARRKNFRLG